MGLRDEHKQGYKDVGTCLAAKETPSNHGILPEISVAETLEERGKRYGKFTGHADITQALKDVMRGTPHWNGLLLPDQKEALEMIAHKIGRILNGDPDYDDSWVDIAGYAQLVTDRIRGVER